MITKWSKKIAVTALICMLLSPAAVYAWGWRKGIPERHDIISIRGHRYHYFGGRYWVPGPMGFWMVNPPIGIMVSILPPSPRVLIVGGITYYYVDNAYYTDTVGGYVVVPPPQGIETVEETKTVVTTTSMPSGKTVVVNVPNSDGTFTEVKLVQFKNGYMGPQGEFYPGKPTVDQLSVLYGK